MNAFPTDAGNQQTSGCEEAASAGWLALPFRRDLRQTSRIWFGESDRLFRLRRGYLPPQRPVLAPSTLKAERAAAA